MDNLGMRFHNELRMAPGNNCVHFFSDPKQIDSIIEEVVDIAKQLFTRIARFTRHNQKLTIDELIKVREHEQDIEQTDSLDPVESENQMTIANLTEGLNSIEKGLQNDSATKRETKKLLVCYEENLREKKNLTRPATLVEYMKLRHQNNFGLRYFIHSNVNCFVLLNIFLLNYCFL
ncbi:hypothetical protein HHI36_004085 [Cryptolaemus montrouzieri]|uniref:Uncharacterized protein n=1 Tax=Cryptolaemus montrouzieri TaxID=559131 RepID=A0ABD2NR52_9CUCU